MNNSKVEDELAILEMGWQQRVVWKLAPATTIGRALLAAAQRLEEAGSDTASLDAQVLLGHVLGAERAWLFAHYDQKLDPTQIEQFEAMVARRVAAEPVAYLIGHREFYGLDLTVDARVLIPRPETELLVDAVLDYMEARGCPPLRMADIGTGSGAIALAVATSCPSVQVYAVDISPDALAVARANVDRLDEKHQISLLQGDLLEGLPEAVDIIAANLPYIASPVYTTLAADVRDYEPRLALESGPEGLDAIRRLLEQAPSHVRAGGVLFLEIAHDQGAAVLRLVETILPQATYVGIRHDYHGYDRLVVVGL
jgi:release factor glutamine methyltransferase